MANFRVSYDHGEDAWRITKDGRHVDWHQTKATAVKNARQKARGAERREGYATLEIRGEGGQVTDFNEYGELPV